MCKIWMSTCIAVVIMVMATGQVSASNRVGNSVQSLVEIELRASNLDVNLEGRALLQSELNLSQNALRLAYNLRELKSISLNSATDLGKLSLKQQDFQAGLELLHLSGAEAMWVIEAPQLRSPINEIKARSMPGSGATLNVIDEGVLGQL